MKKLFYNGIIRTMSATPTVEAVLVDDGKIIAVGDKYYLMKEAPDAELIDMCGNTMLPAFIDAHSHLSSYAMSFLQVLLEKCSNFDEISERVKSFIRTNKIKPGEWVTAKGYDHNALREKVHPTREFLDAVAPENPLVLQHASGHVGVMNSQALKKLGITDDTLSPDGGRIGLTNGKLNGYLEENAFIDYLKKIPMQSMEDMVGAYHKAQKNYAAHGITTIQEGMTVTQMLPLYQFLVSKKMFMLDVVAYLLPDESKSFLQAFPDAIGTYQEHFKIGGYKIVLDGSPQGRTAWMRTPYKDEAPPYYGYGTMSNETVQSAVKTAAEHNIQLLAHCNGDAAAQQYIDAIEAVRNESGKKLFRPVMIHAQLLGTDQLEKVKKLGIIPSFFIAHVYHWGDVHIKNFGAERAAEISPAKSALDKKILFTFHQDTPVIEPNMIETVWCAVNRITKCGVKLGENEKISVIDALKAVTINSAYQYGEEDTKGSIEVGKTADFVILSEDPVTIEPVRIREIEVVQTIKAGKIIFER